MKKHFVNLLFLFLAFFNINAQDLSGDLMGLAEIKNNYVTKRISSYDTTGENNDALSNLADCSKTVIFNVKGAGIINHIWITIGPNNLERDNIILRMYWDGNDFPSVESPLGAFFGQGWNENYEFYSLPLCATPNSGLVCYFAMPFASGAKIEIENQTGREIESFYYYVDYIELDKLPNKMGRFHAWYNHELTEPLPEGENEVGWGRVGDEDIKPNKNPERNYVILDITGNGQFVGINYYVNSPTPMWYGEGDDMIFIDASRQLTLHGTGTEDYFNTAYCPKTKFSHPYFGYARVNDNINWLGRTHIYRFNISDPIYFQKSIKFTIEHGHNNCLTLDLASVAYFYLSEATKLPPIPDKSSRYPKKLIDARDIHKWRYEWLKNNANGSILWGDENEKEFYKY
jgi:hypothetical protein